MKKSLIYAIVGFVTVMCLPFSPAPADDQLITVPDAGFDDHVLTVGDWVYIGDGPYAETSDYTGPWQSAGGDAYIDNGYWAADVDLPALSGNNKLYGYEEVEDYIYQILDETFVQGVTYTLSVWVGEAWEVYDDNWSLYFTGDDYTDELASISGNGPVGEWGQATLVYTATAADAGKRIGIKMKGDAFVTFEDVTLYGPPKTRDPLPADGALLMDTWVNLSWIPANFSVSHDLYMGDNFDDVYNGPESTFQGNLTDTFIIVGFPGFPFPDGLVNGVTYYWRIDGINDTNPNSPLKGDVWSFTVVPKIAYSPDPADGAEFVDPNAVFTWTPGFGGKLHTVYVGTNFDDVNNATGGTPLGTPTYSPGTLELERVYYWRVDEFDPPFTHKGDVWSFTTPGAVGNPQPANGAADVQMIATLSWTPADNAASHELYFGADVDGLGSATTASPEYVGPKALGAESYDPGGLAWGSGYAWRVDEVYPTGTVKGLVWTFSTADFLLVDDFEAYNDIDPPDPKSNRIFEAWIDGFGTTDNGALVGNELPPYAEQSIVHSGVQSMPYFYDNNLKTSEATLTLVYPRDWTAEGVAKLSLWFRGASGNAADRMFVALGNAVVYHDDPAATQIAGWNEWVIDLTEFAGVDLTNVSTITIGFGTKNSPAAGGTGTMYFDDIRLVR
jgi:hypothetical protein